jgi:hypothetical protein
MFKVRAGINNTSCCYYYYSFINVSKAGNFNCFIICNLNNVIIKPIVKNIFDERFVALRLNFNLKFHKLFFLN